MVSRLARLGGTGAAVQEKTVLIGSAAFSIGGLLDLLEDLDGMRTVCARN
jgi:hypothetical protein